MRLLIGLLIACSLLCACGGPRQKPIPWSQALNLQTLMKLKILHVYDGLRYSREPHVTDLVSVRIIEGPESVIGKEVTLPYDSYNTGQEPPTPGTTVLIAPSEWLSRNRRTFGQPPKSRDR